MKQIYSTIMMLALMVAALSITACSGDDEDNGDDGKSSSKIVGTWKGGDVEGWLLDFDDMIEFGEADYFQFKDDGTFVRIYVEEDEIEYGDWKLRNDRLIMHYKDDGTTITYDVISVNKKTLVLSAIGLTFYLEKVPDSVIKKYL